LIAPLAYNPCPLLFLKHSFAFKGLSSVWRFGVTRPWRIGSEDKGGACAVHLDPYLQVLAVIETEKPK